MRPNQDEYFGNLALKGFREISDPETMHWFPPAPGWYVLAALVAVYSGWRIFLAVKRYRADAYRRNALRILGEINASHAAGDLGRKEYLKKLRQLLKATSLIVYPRHEVAGLSGRQWSRFLNQKTDVACFDDAVLDLMEHSSYQQHYEVDSDSLERFSKCVGRWLVDHRRPDTTDTAAS